MAYAEIGDLGGDARLEVAVAGSDGKLFVFDASWTPLLPGGWLESGATTESSPILGDVDGDPGIEIVLGNESGVLHAWDLDGTPVAGFPIPLRAEVRGVPELGDVDGNGSADLAVVCWDGLVRIWDLGIPWLADRAPWPMHRGNAHRTGEYGYEVPTPVAVSDLGATALPDGRVRLAWRAAPTAEPALWRVHRAGPFETRPLGMGRELAYNDRIIGECTGTGSLEFVDGNAAPGACEHMRCGEKTLIPKVVDSQEDSSFLEKSVIPVEGSEVEWYQPCLPIITMNNVRFEGETPAHFEDTLGKECKP